MDGRSVGTRSMRPRGSTAWRKTSPAVTPGARAEVFQEWDTRDADEPGQSLDVYTGGEYQAARARVSGLVPSDLAKSIADVRAALGGSGDLAAAALWLVNGLDGER